MYSRLVEPQFTGPRFTMSPDLPGFPAFSYIHGFTLDTGWIYPIYRAFRFTVLFSILPRGPVIGVLLYKILWVLVKVYTGQWTC